MSERPILLVDDDLDVCEAYEEVLIEAGHEVVIAHNGKEALDYLGAAAQSPCVILLDLMMPIMDGRQFQKELKAIPALRSIPVIMMTADRSTTPADATGYLQKPASLEALLEIVERFSQKTSAS